MNVKRKTIKTPLVQDTFSSSETHDEKIENKRC
jgi:hypothetical protein